MWREKRDLLLASDSASFHRGIIKVFCKPSVQKVTLKWVGGGGWTNACSAQEEKPSWWTAGKHFPLRLPNVLFSPLCFPASSSVSFVWSTKIEANAKISAWKYKIGNKKEIQFGSQKLSICPLYAALPPLGGLCIVWQYTSFSKCSLLQVDKSHKLARY